MILSFAIVLAVSVRQPQHFPTKKGECAWIRGRFREQFGGAVDRIWIVGTTHVVSMGYVGDIKSAALAGLLKSRSYRPLDTAIFGDYLICARDTWVPGHMQSVRLMAARHLFMAK